MVLINWCYCYSLAPLKVLCRDWFLLVGFIVIYWFHWSFRLLIFCFMSEASGGVCCYRLISWRLCTLVYFYHFIYKSNRRRCLLLGVSHLFHEWIGLEIVLLTPWLQRSEAKHSRWQKNGENIPIIIFRCDAEGMTKNGENVFVWYHPVPVFNFGVANLQSCG
jgi:hypothetical protein